MWHSYTREGPERERPWRLSRYAKMQPARQGLHMTAGLNMRTPQKLDEVVDPFRLLLLWEHATFLR